ncbi:MAG: UbiH/UbiF/VisC/COQ6 family ubiquinone biosynthesis hydroxylase [Pontibacterium sp.]
MAQIKADIVIVGAGMMGASVAVGLAETGLSIHLVDKDTACFSTLPNDVMSQQYQGVAAQVSAITPASEAFLTQLGAWQVLKDDYRISDYQKMQVWDGEGTGSIRFDCAEVHQPHLGHIVENRAIRAALFECASKAANIALHSGAEIKQMTALEKGQHYLELSDGSELVTDVLVVADGANSQMRKRLNIPMWEWDYLHHAMVATVRTSQPHQFTAWQSFTGTGPLAFLPLSAQTSEHLNEGTLGSIVWSSHPEHVAELAAMEPAARDAALTRAFEHRLGDMTFISEPKVFPLRQRHAKYYVREGVALLGDAAHTIHPLAGQGANLGFMDAQALVQVLKEAHQKGEPLGDERVLRRFQRQRQRENLKMAAVMEGFERLFDSQQPALRLLRNAGLSLFDRSGPVKQHLMFDAMGLG